MQTNDPKVREILVNDNEHLLSFESLTKAEVSFAGKENIEGYASLVNMFLRSMTMNAHAPCIINIDNIDPNLHLLPLKDAQIFYQATINFKDSFTLMLRKVQNMKTINVKTDYRSMQDGGVNVAAANKLCGKTFAYIGL